MNFIALSGRLAEVPTVLKADGYDVVIWKVATSGYGGDQLHRVAIHDRNRHSSFNLSHVKVDTPVLVAGYVGRTRYEHDGKKYNTTEIICDPIHGYELWHETASTIEGPTSRVFPTWEEWVSTLPEVEDHEN